MVNAGGYGGNLETVREVLVAPMLREQPLPVGFRGARPTEPEDPPLRVVSEWAACIAKSDELNT